MGKSPKLVAKAKKAGVKAMKKRGEFFGTPKTVDVTEAVKAAVSEASKPEVKLTTAPVELSEADKATLAARKAKAAKSAKAHGSPVGEVASEKPVTLTAEGIESLTGEKVDAGVVQYVNDCLKGKPVTAASDKEYITELVTEMVEAGKLVADPTPVVSEAEKAAVLAEAPAKAKKVPTVKTGAGRDSLGSLVGSGASKVNAVMLAAKEPLTVKQVTDLAGGFANTRNHLVKLLVMGLVGHKDGKWSLTAAKAPTTETPKKKGKKAAK